MGLVNFGQPDDGIIQMAYVVKDIRDSIARWVNDLHVGPWFLLDHMKPLDATYRGKPTDADCAVAMSFAGHMMIELIQQHDDKPSVYKETIAERGYGFHHWGVATTEFDREMEKYRARGYEQAFLARVPSGGRVVYMDTTADLPGMVELIELGAAFDPIFSNFYRATIGWDGKDPIRPFF